jgi:hypothetical protein
MKKEIQSYKHYPPMVLWAEDIAALFAVAKHDLRHVVFSSDGVAYTSFGEFSVRAPERVDTLRMTASDEGFVLDISRRGAILYVSPVQFDLVGMFDKVDAILAACETRPPLFFKNNSWLELLLGVSWLASGNWRGMQPAWRYILLGGAAIIIFQGLSRFFVKKERNYFFMISIIFLLIGIALSFTSLGTGTWGHYSGTAGLVLFFWLAARRFFSATVIYSIPRADDPSFVRSRCRQLALAVQRAWQHWRHVVR